ncbi:hypothetical protein V8C86DRAFT_3148949 [Haematococcus lacustris]
MAAAAAGNAALEEVAGDMINFLARCGPRNQDATGLATMKAPWRDVCCGFCVAKTVVPCDMATQSNTEAIVDRTWKLVAQKYPQPGSPKLLKWNKYFAYFNDHFKGIQEASPPEGLKPFASLWDTYKRASPSSRSAADPSPSVSSPHPCPTACPSSRSAADPSPSISSPHPCPTASPSSRSAADPSPSLSSPHPCPTASPSSSRQWPQVGTSPWATGTAAGGQQHQQQQQDLRQVTEEEQQQPGGEGAGPSSSKRPRPAEDQSSLSDEGGRSDDGMPRNGPNLNH